MKKLQLIAICGFIAISAIAQAQNGQVKTSQINGLHTVELATDAGNVQVFLPPISQGATISGTVATTPAGKNKQQVEKNSAYLNGVVVELKGADKKSSPDKALLYGVPVAATALVGFIKDHSGNTLGRFEIPVREGGTPFTPATFDIPAVAQAGEPIFIPGPADGDLHNTTTRVNNRLYTPLAESGDGIFVRPAGDQTGPTRIDVVDNGAVATGTTQLIGVSMSAGNLNLQRGQATQLQVVVSGLEGFEEPVSIMLQNETPGVVQLGGGNQQVFEVQPGQDQYTYTTTVTGLQTGNFGVSAAVLPDQHQDNNEESPTPSQTTNESPTHNAYNHNATVSPADILIQAGNNGANKQNAQAKNPTCNCDQITAKITIENISRKQRLEENLARIIEDIKRVYLQLQNQNLNNQQRADLDKKLATLTEQKKELEDKLKNKVYEEERTVEQDISSSIAQNGDNVWIKVKVSNVDSKVCDCAVPKDCAFLLEYIDGFSKVANPLDSFDTHYKAEFKVTQNNPYLDFTVAGRCIKPGCDDSATKEKKFQITFKLN